MTLTKRRGLTSWQRRKLASYGLSEDDIGRVYNRAGAPPAPGPTPDIDRMVIPTKAAQLEEMLTDSKRMQAVFGKPELFGEFITNYARTVYDRDLSIATQVQEETQRVLADWLRENQPEGVQRLDLTPKDVVGADQKFRKGSLYNPKAMGAAIDKDFSTSGEYFSTIWHNANRTADQQAKLQRVRNAFSSTVPSEGGFLIPEVLRSELLRVALETAIVRSRARVIPMETLRVPFPAIDATSNVSNVYGGIVGYWTEEGATLTASQAAFGRVVLDAKKLTAYTEIPNELISDSVGSFTAFIDEIFPEALSFYEDYGFMRGTGVGEPLGFINCPASVAVTAEAGQPTATIVWENLVKMFARMLPGSLDRAVWIAAIDTFPQLATMALSVGTGGSAIWLNNGAVGPPMTILGRPVIFSEKVPTLGTTGDITFVDLGFYLVGDRQVMSAMSSPHFKFQNDQTAYRIIERVDGRPWLQSAITPKNNSSSTLSPFVQLATR